MKIIKVNNSFYIDGLYEYIDRYDPGIESRYSRKRSRIKYIAIKINKNNDLLFFGEYRTRPNQRFTKKFSPIVFLDDAALQYYEKQGYFSDDNVFIIELNEEQKKNLYFLKNTGYGDVRDG